MDLSELNIASPVIDTPPTIRWKKIKQMKTKTSEKKVLNLINSLKSRISLDSNQNFNFDSEHKKMFLQNAKNITARVAKFLVT